MRKMFTSHTGSGINRALHTSLYTFEELIRLVSARGIITLPRYVLWLSFCCVYKQQCMYLDHGTMRKKKQQQQQRAHAIRTHQYKVNQLKLVKINLKSRIFGVHTIPKSV